MYVIRNVFRCKPGKAKALIEKFNTAHDLMSDIEFERRILVDEVADFWTVVIEVTVADLSVFERLMHERSSRPDVQQTLAGYTDLVKGGYREIFRVA